MKTTPQIKDYLDSEGIICREFDEILDLARDAGGDPKKLDLVLEQGYRDCESEQEFYAKMFEFAGDAPIYDLLKGRSREFLEWVLGKVANNDIHGRVLDIGCGTGLEACLLSGLGGDEVIGIDVNPRLLAESEKRIKRRGLKNVKTRVGDRDNLEFPRGYFDLATCFNSIVTEGEFYGPDAELCYNFVIRDRIKQMAKVLKRGGIAFISMPVSELYGEVYQDKLASCFSSAGFSELIEKTQKSDHVSDTEFVKVVVSAKK